MKVTILRGGGLSGMVIRTELDAQSLAESAAQAFAAHVNQAHVGEEVEDPGGPATRNRWPDAQSYQLCVEKAGATINCHYTEATLPENVRLLLAWVDERPERIQSVE